jgi:phage tail sheath protein FI
MGFLVSPGVEIKEVDLTNVIPAVSTSIGGYVGEFAWGPADEIVTVSTEKELLSKFGKPNTSNFKSFFDAAGFLRYGTTLKIVRQTNSAVNADSGSSTNIEIKNSSAWAAKTWTGSGIPDFVAKYPGKRGNDIKVVVLFDEASSSNGTGLYGSNFDKLNDLAPGQVHVLVLDAADANNEVILEKYSYLSYNNTSAKYTDGTSAYMYEVLNSKSQYVWTTVKSSLSGGSNGGSNGSLFDDFATNKGHKVYTLSGGSDGSTVTRDYSLFADAETVDVNLLIGGECTPTLANNLIAIVEARKDAIAFISPSIVTTSDNTNAATASDSIKTFADSLTSSSYAVIDSTSLYVYDKYNDIYRWISASGHVAGLCANTDEVAEPWFSPAGYTRGQLRGVTKIGLNPNQTQRDTLYKARVNPIVAFPGQGIVLFGDKTAQAKPSAFDRINVRRLFIVLEKAIATAAKYQLFELNDEFTRAMFRNMVEPFLRDVQGRRGITDFQVVCDGTNNTGEIIDTNRFVADIYIKPARSINFITLNFIATRTGVAFSEIAGSRG